LGKALFGEASGDSNWTTVKKSAAIKSGAGKEETKGFTMPPKTKFCDQDIIGAAFQVLRKSGWGSVSARTIASELNASTTPIYTYLKSMKNLEDILLKETITLMEKYTQVETSSNPLVNIGTGVVLFARQEKELYKFINREQFMPFRFDSGILILESGFETVMKYPLFKNLSTRQIRQFLFTSWIFIHGLADLINKSFDAYIKKLTNETEIAEYLAEAFNSIWNGMKFIKPDEEFPAIPEAVKTEKRVFQEKETE
jgi:AcrR family transcriptional regulator